MTEIPTDVVANELSIRLFIFGLAAMAFFEAWKAEAPRRFVPLAFCIVFLLAGLFFSKISELAPGFAKAASELVASPVSWFGLFILAFFVCRVWWQTKPIQQALNKTTGDHNEVFDGGSFKLPVDAYYVQNAISDAVAQLRIHELTASVALAQKAATKAAESAQKYSEEVAKISNAGNEAGLKELSEQVEKLTAFVEQRNRDHSNRMDWIGQGFAALGHWEWHKGAFAELLERGENLRSIAHDKFSNEEWKEWEKLETIWRGRIVSWVVVAEWYAPNAGASVLEIPDHLFYGDWTIDEVNFGKADRVKRYKDSMIILYNLKSVREHVERGMKSAAFEGVGKKARIGQAPPGINYLANS